MNTVPVEEIGDSPVVLDSTVVSNFAYVDRLTLLTVFSGTCTVPEVHSELRAGVNSHPYLQRALDCLGELVPVVGLDKTLTTAVGELTPRLDPGEAQAFAVADGYGGLLVTDDGPARALARENDVSVTGSIGVLVRAVDEGHVSESEADRWLKRWVDETDFRAPSREFSAYL